MSWEIALVVSILGTAFFLVYVATQISSEHWFQKFIKLFLILVSFTFIMQATGVPIFLIDANYNTLTTMNCTDTNNATNILSKYDCTTNTSMGSNTFNEIRNNMGAAFHTTTLIFRILIWIAIFGFILYVLEEMWGLIKKRRGGQG